MRIRLFVLLSLALSSAACAHASAVRYVKLVNTTKSSITAFGIAPPGSVEFRDVALDATGLHGGGESMIVPVDGGATCLRDLRTVFADGRVLIQPGFDVCKRDRYRPVVPKNGGNGGIVARH